MPFVQNTERILNRLRSLMSEKFNARFGVRFGGIRRSTAKNPSLIRVNRMKHIRYHEMKKKQE